MKKSWILLCIMVMLVTSVSIKAGDYATNALRLPYGKNYLDLRNIQRTEPKDIDMHTHIKIRKNVVYTLVMDLDYIGDSNFDQNEEPYLTHCDKEAVNCQIKSITIDAIQKRWYYTFTSTAETLLFRNIPAMATTGYNIMLFEGSYAQFTEFEYYVSNAPIYYSGVYLMDYDHPVQESDIRSQLSVTDPKGGPIKVDLLGGDFEGISQGVGEYSLYYRAMDMMSNTSYYQMTVMVIDRTSPTMTGIVNYTIEHNETLEISSIIEQFSIMDNVDVLNTADITIQRDTYTPNKHQTGTYEIDLSVKDKSLNETVKTVQIQVIDIFSPVISGPDVIYTYLSDQAKTLEEIKSLYTALDDHDGDVTAQIQVNLSDYNGTLLKSHEIYVTCRDAAGNLKVRTVHIHVIDDTAPIFHTTDYIMTYDDYDMMTKEDIILWLEQALQASGVAAKNLKILLDETEHLQTKRDKAFIYYSYDVEGVTYQSRLAISYNQQTRSTVYIYVGLSMTVLAGSWMMVKKLKKRQ